MIYTVYMNEKERLYDNFLCVPALKSKMYVDQQEELHAWFIG
jgi:hypothetical protein